MKTEKSSTYNHLKHLAERKWFSGYACGMVAGLLIAAIAMPLGMWAYNSFFKEPCITIRHIRQVPYRVEM